jgi:large subunit ribosomal protein L21
MNAPKVEQVAQQYVVFQTGGKQYQAIPGKTLAIEKIEGEPGAALSFSEVLLRKTGEDAVEIGTPYVSGAVLKASIVKQMRGDKLVIFRHKRRKKSRVRKGHRQPITVIRIESIA